MNGFPCIELLADIRDNGYPDEYLFSRVRGRRSRMVADWRAMSQELPLMQSGLSTSRKAIENLPAAIWRGLLREHRWVYGQMNRDLREVFAPYFLYTEIRTICTSLRGSGERKAETIGEMLSVSLLKNGIKNVLLKKQDTTLAVKAVERFLLRLSAGFAGLAGLLEKDGLRAVEQRLTDHYLATAVNADLHTLLRTFFLRIIDARNALSLYKFMKLDAPARPPYIPGGSMIAGRFNEILKKGDMPEVLTLVRKMSGIRIDLQDAGKIESALYRGMTRELRKSGRDPLHMGLILSYLWKCSIEAMNRSVLIHTKELDRETVMAELVQ